MTIYFNYWNILIVKVCGKKITNAYEVGTNIDEICRNEIDATCKNKNYGKEKNYNT